MQAPCPGRAPNGSGRGPIRAAALGNAGGFLRGTPVVLGEDQLHRALEHGARRTGARGEPVIELPAVHTKEGGELVTAALQVFALLENASTHLGPSWVHHGRPQSKPRTRFMSTARFRFAEDLSRFLRPAHRGRRFDYACARAANLKNAIEALGVPHTEVGELTVNGVPATLQRIVREGDDIEVLAPRAAAPVAGPLAFIADAHLGGLGRFLRMLGFDTVHEPRLADAEIRALALAEARIVLTRDRDLLKCRDIARGCYVRALKPEAQLREVVARYGLAPAARPFTRCLHCNLPLAAVDKAVIAHRLPPKVAELHQRFTYCSGCGRIYWPGSHYARMCSALAKIGVRSTFRDSPTKADSPAAGKC